MSVHSSRWYAVFIACTFSTLVLGQQPATTVDWHEEAQLPPLFSLASAPTFHKQRFWVSAGAGITVYGGVSAGLWKAWYKNFPRTRFHTFNDWNEWMGVDKAGHLFSAYMASNYSFQGANWTGMPRRRAMWTAIGIGMGIQTTIEVMDGFSEKWGFSWGDMAFNALGAGVFATQELLWQEQRIVFKSSGQRPAYSSEPVFSDNGERTTTLKDRAVQLYGTSPFEAFIKDYNALTTWGSVNISSFIKKRNSRFPRWLNLAVGYGAGNIYGGEDNTWTTEDGIIFTLDEMAYPRYRRFYLSPDIDWTRIPSRHRWVKFTLGLLNWVKIPAPVLELNTLGNVHFHPMRW
ncbi:MAG: DUF2279 domain-containing protein [Saprospiraceae bacterium]